MKEIYAFGSICRGEIDEFSDVDTLLITDENIRTEDSTNISTYTPKRISQLWEFGDPFAWHLYYEAKLIYSSETKCLMQLMGAPQKYTSMKLDIENYEMTYLDSMISLKSSNLSPIFDAGGIFVGVRNAAISFSLASLSTPVFSRDAAINIGEMSLAINQEVYKSIKFSRLAATRGLPYRLTKDQIQQICNESANIEHWFSRIKGA